MKILVSILMIVILFSPSVKARSLQNEFEKGYSFDVERNEFTAARDFMEFMLDLYVPALKQKLITFEDRLEEYTEASGAIYLNKEEASDPEIIGEAKISNKKKEKLPSLEWSIKTSIDANSGVIGMELWKDIGIGRVILANEIEQDFSEDSSVKVLIKLEKRF